jgi:hypothetical protein
MCHKKIKDAMKINIDDLEESCKRNSFTYMTEDNNSIRITLFQNITLVITNISEDCSLIGFSETKWHAHDTIMFTDKNGYYIELNYLEILEGISNGSILIIEEYDTEILLDRYLAHQDYFDELKYIKLGTELRIKKYDASFTAHN